MAVVFFPRLFYRSCDIPSLSLAVLRLDGRVGHSGFFRGAARGDLCSNNTRPRHHYRHLDGLAAVDRDAADRGFSRHTDQR